MASWHEARTWHIDEEDELVRLLLSGEVLSSFATATATEVSRCGFALACALDRKFNKYFEPIQVTAKLVSMLRRYRLFTEFIAHPKINYDIATNVVTYNHSDWPQIIRHNHGFALYANNGERLWTSLQCIFSGQDLTGLNAMVEQGNSTAPIYIEDSNTTYEYEDPGHVTNADEHIASTQENFGTIVLDLSSNDEHNRAPIPRYARLSSARTHTQSTNRFRPSSSVDSERSTARTRKRS